ncbi:DNA primase small subunit isoform X2 [Rhynchophorus ferrugineus]|uniref:DNA primase small subunit isoform X2 n=1 Tax=Rhynchophorus ferrugineus TaxID=354439 RepID=UPI003FCE47DD
MSAEYIEEQLSYLLPIYYKRLFPSLPFYRWLSYGKFLLDRVNVNTAIVHILGKSTNFSKREISFTLIGDIYLRFQSFDTHADFVNELCKRFPIKIDIGCVYQTKPRDKNMLTALIPVFKEVVFDIDMTDYDEIRTCCSGADVCNKCWKFMAIASKIIDATLREDFGFKHILWVFSGRRGIHAWVCDESARTLDDNVRSAIVEYMYVIKGGLGTSKKVNLVGNVHHSLKRALSIIDKYFIQSILKDQDILGTQERLDCFLNMVDEEVREIFRGNMRKLETSEQRWHSFEKTFADLQSKGQLSRGGRNMIEEMKLYYAYPRLDVNVSKALNHLLKAPFCVHPKTGKICIPFNVKNVDNFDLNNVPTLNQLMEQIDLYDKKTKEQDNMTMETDESTLNKFKIKDYKKTSLLGPVNIFMEFLRGLESKSEKRKMENADLNF